MGILKMFIKGFGLILFVGTQPIGLSAICVWIFERRECFIM